jgi:hypothetical protein
MLADRDPYTAAALSLLGHREGMALILESADDLLRYRGDFFSDRHDTVGESVSFLFALNALRTPKIRAELEGKTLPPGPAGDSWLALAKSAARAAGMAFVGDGASDENRLFRVRRQRPRNLWEALLSTSMAVHRIPGDASEGELILDEGTFRFMDYEDAVRFWKTWAGK